MQRDNNGDLKLKVSIRNSEVQELNTDKKVKVFGIIRRGRPYLDPKEVLERDTGSRESAPWVILRFSALALGICIFRRYYYENDL